MGDRDPDQPAHLPPWSVFVACLQKLATVEIYIGLDKSAYQVSSFLISAQKHMLWVLIRSASPLWGISNEYPQEKCQYF